MGIAHVAEDHRPPNPLNSARAIRNRIDVRTDGLASRFEFLWLGLLLLILLAAAAAAGHRKPLWYDEIFTIFAASQPTWHRYIQILPVEGNPPINTLLTRLSLHLFGLSSFTVRLPALLGVLTAFTGLYVFVRRECGVVLGLLAVALTMAQPVWRYSYEARPYGLLMGFLMLGLVSWQAATRAAAATPARPRRLALAGLALATVGCTLSHHLGIVNLGIPLLCGEAVRLFYRRRVALRGAVLRSIDWHLAAAVILPLAASLVVELPLIHRTRHMVVASMAPVTSHRFSTYLAGSVATLGTTVSVRALLWLTAVVAAAWLLSLLAAKRRSGPPAAAPRVPAHVMAAAIGLALLIPVTLVIMSAGHGWWFARYGIGSGLGIGIVATFLLARPLANRSALPAAAVILLTLTFVRLERQYYRHGLTDSTGALVYAHPSPLPVVITDPLAYPQIWWYTPATRKQNIVYLSDSPSMRPGADVLIERCLVLVKPLEPMPVQDYRSFTNTQQHFLLDAGKLNSGMKNELEGAGFKVTLLSSDAGETLFDVQR